MRKLSAVLLALIFVLGYPLPSLSVSAIDPIVTDKNVDLTLEYEYNGTVFQGLTINIYRVANVHSNTVFSVDGKFGDYAVSINTVKSQMEWNVIAQTFMSYVIADSIETTASAVTDEKGKVTFNALETGLYLVSGARAEYDKGQCTFDSFMMMLPAANGDGTWNYQVNAKPKSLYVQTQPDDVEYSILKLWKDTGYEAKRPTAVEAELYKDGEYVETVSLTAENNWHYRWTAPGDGAVWTVVETNVATGYTVTVEQKETTFIISNTYSQTPPPPETGDSFNLAMYVMMAAVAGLVLIVIGVISRRRA